MLTNNILFIILILLNLCSMTYASECKNPALISHSSTYKAGELRDEYFFLHGEKLFVLRRYKNRVMPRKVKEELEILKAKMYFIERQLNHLFAIKVINRKVK